MINDFKILLWSYGAFREISPVATDQQRRWKSEKRWKPADKPGSVRTSRSLTAIPLGPGLLQGSSHLPASSVGHVIACLFGVAPGGGCLAVRFTADAVRSYRTVSPLPDPPGRASARPSWIEAALSRFLNPSDKGDFRPPCPIRKGLCGPRKRGPQVRGHRRSRLCGPVPRLTAGGD